MWGWGAHSRGVILLPHADSLLRARQNLLAHPPTHPHFNSSQRIAGANCKNAGHVCSYRRVQGGTLGHVFPDVILKGGGGG